MFHDSHYMKKENLKYWIDIIRNPGIIFFKSLLAGKAISKSQLSKYLNKRPSNKFPVKFNSNLFDSSNSSISGKSKINGVF